MSAWHDGKGNITIDSLPDLLAVSQLREFGEGGQESLVAWLMTSAYEHQPDHATARAFHLAAMIISRAQQPKLTNDTCAVFGHLYRCEQCGEARPPGG